jgi:glycosyltransferase involved in cell wall biosynthesis
MKLLFGIKALDVPGGGAERVLAIVTAGLARRGHEVTALSFDRPGGNSFYPLDEGVQRICLGLGPTDSPTGLNHFFRRLPVLRRVLGEVQPDVAVGFMHSMFVPMAVVASSLGIPMVASEHTVPEYYRDRWLEYTLCTSGCLLADRVTVLSRAVQSLYPAILRKRMVPIPNPVKIGTRCLADPAGNNRDRKTVLSVGRLDGDKDHTALIEAFAGVAGRFPDWNLRIVGDGRLRGFLENQVVRHGLKDRVFLPETTQDIESEYAAAQLFAVPSRVESFGLATAEALAAGLPVIGFANCPGTRELVRDGVNGLLIDPGMARDRVSALKEGLEGLMEDDSLRGRMGNAGRQGLQGFDPDVVTSRWEALIVDVLAGR